MKKKKRKKSHELQKEHSTKSINKLKQFWKWLNDSDSILADLIWVLIFYVAIRWILFPGIGLLLHTSMPLVAVVSGSMHHDGSFDEWWNSRPCGFCKTQKEWYLEHNITKEMFLKFPFHDGLNKGDVVLLVGKNPKDVQIGDVIVFTTPSGRSVIHRVIKKWYNGKWHFQTKGDHNPDTSKNPLIKEYDITEDRLIGVAIFRIPIIGYPKAWLTDLTIKG